MHKKRLLVIHPALAPYRIDFFNSLNGHYNAVFYFFNNNLLNQKFDQGKIKEEVTFNCKYLLRGINLPGRSFRFGIYRTIRVERPNIVICSEFNLINLAVIISKVILNKKIRIYTICDDNVFMATNASITRKLMRAIIIRLINGVILTNERTAEWYSNKFASEFIVFPIIRDENKYANDLKKSESLAQQYLEKYNLFNKKIFLYVGRLVKEKNLERLIEAFDIIHGKNSDSFLIIVGSGSNEDVIKKQVIELGLKNAVIFTGRLEGANLSAIYLCAGVFVLPSVFELFGAVINEALLAGCYTLVSKVAGGASLIKEGVNGRLIDPEDVWNIANRMLECLSNDSLFANQGELRNSRMLVHYNDAITSLVNKIN
ncbi:MAG TPA: glycosyltransferase [Bacteroidales bacterium]|nr:glycosyltransferase [Bacteroidales bacterium]